MDHRSDPVAHPAEAGETVDEHFSRFSSRLAAAGGIAHRASSIEDAVETIVGIHAQATTTDLVPVNESLDTSQSRASGPDLQDAVIWASSQLVQQHPALVAALERRGHAVCVPDDAATVRDQPMGLAVARMAIAETGSVLLQERELADRSASLMTNVLVVICPSEALKPSLDDAAPVLREISRASGSYATLVTGPSRTADIERQLTVGVQGPGEMHVVFVPGASTTHTRTRHSERSEGSLSPLTRYAGSAEESPREALNAEGVG